MALRPVRMAKIGILGLRSDEERILTVLHDLRIAQVEPLTPETLAELGPERGTETLRRIGDETLRFRGLRSALPEVGPVTPIRFDRVDDILRAAEKVPIDEEVGALVREDDRLQTEEKATDDSLELLQRITFYPDRLDLLRSKSILAFYGEADAAVLGALRSGLPPESDAELFLGPEDEEGVRRFVLVGRSSAGEAISTVAQSEGIRLVSLPALSGTVVEEAARLGARREGIARRRGEIRERLLSLARVWFPSVAAIDEALQVENRKTEILSKLGASSAAFALEAWVPERELPRLRAALEAASGGRVFYYSVATKEEPPTLMRNPPGVRRFEFFIRFYSLPQASEWDPTLVFSIVFPIFFGFMLGDWGYGLVILLISLWMLAGFPGARHLPKSGRNFVRMIMGPKGMQQLAWVLLPGCAIAIGLGLFWDEFFGFGLLHRLVDYVPPLKPDANVGILLLFAGYVGLGMVVLGFTFGALKEYFHHHPRGVLAKSGGILFAIGIAFFGLALIHHATSPGAHPVVLVWYALIASGLAFLIGGEGIQAGMLGLIEVVSHILSYTRLVGILLASVILALVINTIGGGLVAGGTAVGIIFGIMILVIGQSFNVILGVFEPGIQGARLIFVEYFSKFYSGNGRPFRPFGAARTHTVSSVGPDGHVGPIVQTPPS